MDAKSIREDCDRRLKALTAQGKVERHELSQQLRQSLAGRRAEIRAECARKLDDLKAAAKKAAKKKATKKRTTKKRATKKKTTPPNRGLAKPRDLEKYDKAFARKFHAAFARWAKGKDRAFVPLAKLRDALREYGPEAFDYELEPLLYIGEYALHPHDSEEHGELSAKNLAAAIHKGPTTYVYVTRAAIRPKVIPHGPEKARKPGAKPQGRPKSTAGAVPAAFAAALDRAFAELGGSRNLVSLYELRAKLAEYDRDDFDRHLDAMIEQGAYVPTTVPAAPLESEIKKAAVSRGRRKYPFLARKL